MADAACLLLSPLARGITGEIVHVDGGFHAVGCPSPASVRGGSATADGAGSEDSSPAYPMQGHA